MNIITTFFYDLIDQVFYIEIPKDIEIEANKNMVY